MKGLLSARLEIRKSNVNRRVLTCARRNGAETTIDGSNYDVERALAIFANRVQMYGKCNVPDTRAPYGTQ